jgi:CRISPR/Cas system CSM-associated protein Csm3 (group 7 of RAMP superfamily)
MFGSGFMDDEANMTPVYEKIIDYKKQDLSEEKILIPASSVKGAISHRTTYYYNLLNNKFINKGGNADIVESIFGAKKDNEKDSFKGNILISDVYLEKTSSKDTKVFDHVSIDRFTGGAIDSALFQEKTIASKETFTLEILINKEKVQNYFCFPKIFLLLQCVI